MLGFFIILINIAGGFIYGQPVAKSEWIYPGKDGRLIYKELPAGDRIMDFSHAGYMGGGVAIPTVAVKKTIKPVEGDNSINIQAAIDEVSNLPIINGVRGTVLLGPGFYTCEKAIIINADGVVLRGSGAGEDGSVITMTGKPHTCISIKGSVKSKSIGAPTRVTDSYVPAGSYSFTVNDGSGFKKSDTINITRPVTDEWVKFMGMDQMYRDGKKQTWINGEITIERVIGKVEKNKISVYVPLNDSYDSKFTGTGVMVQKVSTSGELSQIGIENLRIVAPAQSVTINEDHHRAFTMSGCVDSWAKNIEIINTVNSISVTGKRITVDQINIVHELPTVGAAKPADLNGSGQQLFFNKCTIKGDNLFFFGTGAKVGGPVVLLNCIFRGNGWIQPHQRWASGLLIDNCLVPEGGIDFMNRGSMGSGHGWAIGWAVAWNCVAKSYLNQWPPGSANWVIGSKGEKQQRAIPFDTLPLLKEGIYDSHGIPVEPKSLFLSQLKERLGNQALLNIHYEIK